MKLCSKAITSINSHPALFLDRDGVINLDHGYVHVRENFDFMPGIFELVLTAKANGFLCIVVTNQAGIGRGLYTLGDFRALSEWMCGKFKANGAEIDAIYYSPFHPTKGKGAYLVQESTRKPGFGMFTEAIKELNIDISKSIMVGDKVSDMQASIAANIGRHYLLRPNASCDILYELDSKVNLINSLSEINFNFVE